MTTTEIKEKVGQLLTRAVTAPSGDNSQPWWFHWDGDVLEVNLVFGKDNQILNFRQSGTYVALGALLENIVILASKEKLSPELDILPKGAGLELVARLKFIPTSSAQDSLADFVSLRATNRKPYKKTPVEENVVNDILASSAEVGGGEVVIITDSSGIKKAASASSTMERIALETEDIHRLFFSNMIWSTEDAKKGGMGLPIATTELPYPIQLLFRAIRRWSVTRVLNKLGLSVLAAKANAQTYASTPSMGIITIAQCSSMEYILAGRVLERVWVKATKHGLALHPVTGVLFLAQRVLNNEVGVFHQEHIPLIMRAYETIAGVFSSQERMPALLFRLGYADAPSANTFRRPPEFR